MLIRTKAYLAAAVEFINADPFRYDGYEIACTVVYHDGIAYSLSATLVTADHVSWNVAALYTRELWAIEAKAETVGIPDGETLPSMVAAALLNKVEGALERRWA